VPGERILILGCSGAGKSTLARRIGERTGFPVTHLDALFWQPGWIEDHPEFDARAIAAASADSWIIEGGYTGRPSFALRATRADTVILLDFDRWRCLARVLWRAVQWRGRSRPDMAQGCPEKVDLPFLAFIWNWRRISRPKVFSRLAAFGRSPQVLRTPGEVAAFLARFDTARPPRA